MKERLTSFGIALFAGAMTMLAWIVLPLIAVIALTSFGLLHLGSVAREAIACRRSGAVPVRGAAAPAVTVTL